MTLKQRRRKDASLIIRASDLSLSVILCESTRPKLKLSSIIYSLESWNWGTHALFWGYVVFSLISYSHSPLHIHISLLDHISQVKRQVSSLFREINLDACRKEFHRLPLKTLETASFYSPLQAHAHNLPSDPSTGPLSHAAWTLSHVWGSHKQKLAWAGKLL